MGLSGIALLLVANTALAVALSPLTNRPCNIAFRCSNELSPVWASDGDVCLVFRNDCHLASANCDRQNNYEEDLEEISREKCQKLCSKSCPEDDNPVCGYLGDDRRTFDNSCEMDKYSCETGLPYGLYNEGPCSQD